METATQAYEKGKSLFGDKNFIVLFTRKELAECHAASGDYATAIEIAKSVYADYVEQYGEDYPEALKIRDALEGFQSRLT